MVRLSAAFATAAAASSSSVSCGGSVLDPSIAGSGGALEPPPAQAGNLGNGGSVGNGSGGANSVSEIPIKRRPGCNSTFIDYDCDGSMDSCRSGQHRDYLGGSCSACVPDSASDRSCEWGRSRYQHFLAELTRASCADYCDEDSDCYVSELSNACASACKFALFGAIDEEIVWAAAEFARESCAPFCVTEPPRCPERSGAACVDNHCVMVP